MEESKSGVNENYAYNAVIILREKNVEDFTDIQGIDCIEIEDNQYTQKLKEGLEKAFIGAKKIYKF